jgi:hypothetical protein
MKTCEDCEDEIPEHQRRRKCKSCGKMVCAWCHHHVHELSVHRVDTLVLKLERVP